MTNKIRSRPTIRPFRQSVFSRTNELLTMNAIHDTIISELPNSYLERSFFVATNSVALPYPNRAPHPRSHSDRQLLPLVSLEAPRKLQPVAMGLCVANSHKGASKS